MRYLGSYINVRMHTFPYVEYLQNTENAHKNSRDREGVVEKRRQEGWYRAGKAHRKQRIEMLGFSLETDDACGSLRVRDYERQLEIRSKQMDCENTLSLSLSLSLSLPPLIPSLSLHVRTFISLSISLIFTRAPRPIFAWRELQAI